MRKFTFMILAAFMAVMAYAQKPVRLSERALLNKSRVVPSAVQGTLKTLPRDLAAKRIKARAPKKVAVADLSSLAGDYTWDYATADNYAEDATTVEGSAGSGHVVISVASAEENTLTISGMFTNDLTATVDPETGVITIVKQAAGTSSYGDYDITGLYYFEGNDEDEAGWYYTDIEALVQEDGTIQFADDTWFCRVLTTGNYAGYTLTPYWMPSSTLTPSEALSVVELPEGVEVEEFNMTYTSGSATATRPINVGVDGNDVYFQGMSNYLPEAWVKGVRDGNVVTFAGQQYMGEYGSYGSSVFFYEGPVDFTYNEEDGSYSATGQVYGVLADRYYDGNYTDPVLKKVVEVAAMPANPEITALKNGSYGWYFDFNVPAVDTEGNGLVSSKLFYQIYTDVEGEVSELTFTPETHTRLTESMTVIPYGFTENYDFYDNTIYLNDLYSADWNKLGIRSIYYGGGETNATEIQWYEIKPYYVEPEGHVWVAADQEYNNQQTVTDITIDEGITGVFAQNSAQNPSRYYTTGSAVRAYAGNTLTLTSDGDPIVKVEFAFDTNNGSKMPAFDVEVGEMEIAEDGTTGVWTGEANEILFSVPNVSGQQTRVQSIKVLLQGEEEGGGEDPVEEDVLVELPEGVEAQEYTLEANGYNSEGSFRINETMLVAFDGNDVYVQGLAYYFPEAFVKGQLNEDGQVVFQSGQFLGEDEYGKEYLVGVAIEGSGLVYAPEFVFDYDAESGVLSLAEGSYYGESSEKIATSFYNYFNAATYTPGALVIPDLVELPEGVESQVWTLEGTFGEEDSFKDVQRETEVAFDGTDVYVKGLSYYFEDAWLKGTLDTESSLLTIPSGQFVGKDDYGMEFMVGFDGSEISDIQFAYDAEAQTLTQQTMYILENQSADEINFWGYLTDAIYYAGEPIVAEPIVVPEGLVAESYLFTAMEVVEEEEDEESYEVRKEVIADNEDEDEDEIEVTLQPYSFQTQIGFDGNDVYFKGFSENTADMWAKGTLSEDGKTVTIPANQFMGELSSLWYTFNYYLTAVDEDLETMEDLVLNYDAETNTFTTDQIMVLNGTKRSVYPYQTFTAVEFTKMVEVAATPADPSIDEIKLEGVSYPRADFIIPATDTEGNAILTSKLAYTIWVEKEGEEGAVQEPLTLAADLYTYLDEDMTEIPYTFDDSYDIYSGGSRVYLNQPSDEIASWKKIGIQSIYYGGDECNKSNIVWSEELYTGINNMSATQGKAVYYDLQGRIANAQTKGLLIKQVRQADGTIKNLKVIRK